MLNSAATVPVIVSDFILEFSYFCAYIKYKYEKHGC